MRNAFCLICLLAAVGCKTTTPQSNVSTTGTAAPATTVSDQSAAPATAAAPASNTTRSSTTDSSSRFSLSRILGLTNFTQQPQAAPLSPEVTRLQQLIQNLSTQTSQLSINDPPEVTREKAQGILASLGEWEAALEAGRAVGLLNQQSVQTLKDVVARLQTEAQKLVQYAPRAETIAAIQQLAGQLQIVSGLVGEGATLSQRLLGSGS